MIILPAIKERTDDYEAIETAIKILFKKEIYIPLLRQFGGHHEVLRNANPVSDLQAAIVKGTVTFNRGVFSGRFNSSISKELRLLGATFHRPTSTYRIGLKELPYDVRSAVQASEIRFQEKLAKIDEELAAISPEAIAVKLKVNQHFDSALWKLDRDFKKSVKGITIAPELTASQRARIASEWGENMQLWIRDFTEKEIVELRQNMQKTVFAGDRFGSAVKTIQASYGVTANKAKFLARQETSLLMTKFKQTRYQAAGVEWYKWGCVSGTKQHPVRPMHLKNKDQFFRWDKPPTVDDHGNRKNPGQDYNCRCFARPAVGYRLK